MFLVAVLWLFIVVVGWASVNPSLLVALLARVPFLPRSLRSYISEHDRALAEGAAGLAREQEEEQQRNNQATQETKQQQTPKKAAAAAATSPGPVVVSVTRIFGECRQRAYTALLASNLLAVVGLQLIYFVKPKLVGDTFDLLTTSAKHTDAAPQSAPSFLSWLRTVFPGHADHAVFFPHMMTLLLLHFLEFVLMSIRDWASYGHMHRFRRDVRADMLQNLLTQDSDYLQTAFRGETINTAMAREVERLNDLTTHSLARLAGGLIEFFGGISALLWADRRIAALGILLKAPILIRVSSAAARDIAKYHWLYAQTEGRANAMLERVLQSSRSVQLIQANVLQSATVRRFRSHLDRYIHYLYLTHFRETMCCFAGHLVANTEDVLLMAVGFQLVLTGSMTLGQYYAFRALLNQYASGWNALKALYTGLAQVQTTSAKYFEYMYRTSAIPLEHGVIPLSNFHGHLEFKRVGFSFMSNPEKPILRNVSIDVRPGKILALVGRTGVGKTTIANLMLRFFDPRAGEILLDGANLKTYHVNWLRTQIKVVDQEPQLLDGFTIAENIGAGLDSSSSSSASDKDSGLHMAQIHRAARIAQAHNFILDLEQGYSTMMGSRPLSGGQRQRIAIARALASSPKILILDEVTASLDNVTEHAVMSAICDEARHRKMAVVLIAHRLSTVRHADEICFMRDGTVVERGTHDELVAMRGDYHALLNVAATPAPADPA